MSENMESCYVRFEEVPNLTCDDCGQILGSMEQMKEHLEGCHEMFKQVAAKLCRFFYKWRVY